MAREVRSPDGRVWTLRRRALAWWPRWSGPRLGLEPAGDGTGRSAVTDVLIGILALGDDLRGALAFLAALVAASALVVVAVLPGGGATLKVVVGAVLVVAGSAVRMLLRQIWIVAASTDGPPAELRSWRVTGWQRTGTVADQVAVALRTGSRGPASGDVEPLT